MTGNRICSKSCLMKNAIKTRFTVPALLLGLASAAHGQAVPAGTSPMTSFSAGPNLPNLDGVLHYSLSASEIFQFGYNGPGVETHSTTLSGNVAYTAKSEVRPFNMVPLRRLLPRRSAVPGQLRICRDLGLAGLRDQELGLQHLRLLQLSAPVSDDRPVGHPGSGRSWERRRCRDLSKGLLAASSPCRETASATRSAAALNTRSAAILRSAAPGPGQS